MAAQTVFKRYEKKYLMNAGQEKEFLERIEGYMKMDKYGLHTICNIYFDTDDFDLIRTSIEKPIYKEKLRLRTYGVPMNTDVKAFVEIKKKFKGIVYKRREEMTLLEAQKYLYEGIHPRKDSQILREIDWFLKMNPVKPKVFLAYDRRAFAGLEDKDFRLTLDKNIRCRRTQLYLTEGSVGEKILDDDTTLMEIKVAGSMPMWMTKILSDLKICPVSISKYGTYYKGTPELVNAVCENHRQYYDPTAKVVDFKMLQNSKPINRTKSK